MLVALKGGFKGTNRAKSKESLQARYVVGCWQKAASSTRD